jgi:predicted transcriptional regulator
MAQREYELGDAELEVLKVLWTLKQGCVRDVLEELHRGGRNVAYTTVQTMLTRLEQKGVVASDRSGPAFVYKPRVSQHRFRQARVKSLMDQLFDGAAGPLVLQLLQTQKLRPDEVHELQKLIDRLDAPNPPDSKGPPA